MKKLISVVCVLALAGWMVGCGAEDTSTPPADTGGAVTPPDAGGMPTPDAGGTPTPDAGGGETPDAGGTPDASGTPDAGSTTEPEGSTPADAPESGTP